MYQQKDNSCEVFPTFQKEDHYSVISELGENIFSTSHLTQLMKTTQLLNRLQSKYLSGL